MVIGKIYLIFVVLYTKYEAESSVVRFFYIAFEKSSIFTEIDYSKLEADLKIQPFHISRRNYNFVFTHKLIHDSIDSCLKSNDPATVLRSSNLLIVKFHSTRNRQLGYD